MRRYSLYILPLAALLTVGCSHSKKNGSKAGDGKPVYYAVAELHPTKGSKAKGTVHFSEAFGKVRVKAEVTGLDPNSKHGFHIHEYGDCTAADATSAGGHYSPDDHQHGAPGEKSHAGDLGNLEANAKGKATFELEIPGISVNSGPNPIIGRGMIVHQSPDDLVSQPTGGAGKRIACGVIGAASK